MILDQEKITRIKRLLKLRPKGLTISDISHNLKINRNSVAKYLEILLITGQVEMKMYGNAKVYYLSNRVPISSMLRFANELILVLDENMKVVEANDNFFSYFPVKKEDLIGNPISTCPLNTVDDFRINDMARDAIVSGEVSREISIIRGNETKYLHIKVVPSVFDDGTKGTTFIFDDITEKKKVEDLLRFSESKYRAIVEDQIEMVDRFDKDFRILFANKAVCQHFGLDPEKMVGKNILDFLPIEDRNALRDHITSITPENPVTTIEHRVIDAKGGVRWHQWTNRGIIDEQGNISAYQGVGRDITDKKEAEQALLVKNFAVASSLNGIGIADLSGNVTYVNASFLRMFGYNDKNEVLGKAIHFFSHDHEDTKIPIVLNALQDHGGWSGEVIGWKRDGSRFYAILTANMVRDSSGIPLCLMASFLDTTEIKRNKEELQLKDTAIASSINAIAIFDQESHLIYANDSFLTEFELTLKEIKGKQPRDLVMQFDSVAPPNEEIEARLKNEGKWNGELLITGRDGRRQYFTASFRRMVDSQGSLLSTLASFVNITELKSIENALKSTRQNLSETIEFIPDPTFIINRDHQVIAWNRALELLTGVKREEVIGKEDFEKVFSFFQKERPILVNILDLPPHELARRYPNVRRYRDSIYVEAFVRSMNDGNGAYLWGKATSLVDHEGNIIGAIESIRDISAWKRARESLRKIDAGERSPGSVVQD